MIDDEPEDAWCGPVVTEEQIRSEFEEAVKSGYPHSYEKFLGDYL